MSNTVIQLKHSTETGNVPSGLVNGEIAINTFDGKLFYRDPTGVTQSIQNFPGPAGLNGEVQFNDSGDLGSSANLTFDKTTGNLSSQSVHTRTYIEFGDGTRQYSANVGEGGGGTVDQTARNTANAAFDKANSANVLAQASFDKANSANVLAQAAFDQANTIIVFDQDLNTSNDVTFNRITTRTGEVYVNVGNTFLVTTTPDGSTERTLSFDTFGTLRTYYGIQGQEGLLLAGQDGEAYSSLYLPKDSSSNTQAVQIYNLNQTGKITLSANVYNWTFNYDGTLIFPDNTVQTTAYRTVVWDTANAAFNKANSANVLAQNAYNFANTRYSSSGGTISGDVQISGNLIVVGNTVTYSANDVIVNDPILLIANNNSDNVLDIGFSAHYVESANLKHTGLIRDVSTSTWYLFEGYEPDIQGANILNIADPTLVISNLKANLFGNANTATTWQTARTITIGSTGKSVDGSGAVSWTLSEIGAQTAGSYVTTDTAQTIGGIKTFANNFLIASTTVIANLNADLLDGQEGSYYLDWTNVTNKPDPVVTVTLTGDVTGTANTTLTDLASGTITIATTIAANSIVLGTDTTGNYVATITGTTNQVTVSGSGTETAAVTLSLPQNIHTAATPTFSRLTLSQATGTAPLTVSSTTVVTNLNVDLLDGQHGSYYSNATNINAGTLDASRLPTVGTAGTYGNSTHVPVITTDAYGRVSSVTNTTISFPAETDTLQSVTDRGNTSDRIITLSNTTKTTSNTTGSLLVAGGIAVTGNVALQQILFADGTSMNTAATGTGGGASITWTRKTANYTAVNGDRIIADTSAGSFVITLPATPSTGDVIVIADGNNWSVNTLNVARNGATIEGFSEDLQLDIPGIRVDLVYDGTTWEAYTFATPQTSVNNDNTTNTTQYVSMARQITGPFTNSYVSSTKLYFNPSSGALSATDFNSLSDATLKEDITSISNVMNIIDSINAVEFKWKDNSKKSYGVIAQEIEKVLPEIVSTNQDTNLKSVSYIQLIPLLLEAIKELKTEINSLKKRKK